MHVWSRDTAAAHETRLLPMLMHVCNNAHACLDTDCTPRTHARTHARVHADGPLAGTVVLHVAIPVRYLEAGSLGDQALDAPGEVSRRFPRPFHLPASQSVSQQVSQPGPTNDEEASERASERANERTNGMTYV